MEYSQLGYMLKSHHVLCLLSVRFFHAYNVLVGWLVDCISRLNGSVELTLRYTTLDIRCRHDLLANGVVREKFFYIL